jgi:choline kinase
MIKKIEHAIVLTAGIGKRLKPLTDHSPKCLTEVNRRPILLNTLENLSAIGVKYCTIVTGYLGEKIEATAGSRHKGVEIRYVRNDIYESTSDMYSLWLAREVMKNGTLILEGDIFFMAHTMKAALDDMGGRSFYLAGRYNGKPDEVVIQTDGEQLILSIKVLRGESALPDDHTFMSSGILVIQPDYGTAFSRWLSQWVKQNRVAVLFDDVLSAHATDLPLWVYELSSDDWVEIDTREDLLRAETIFR